MPISQIIVQGTPISTGIMNWIPLNDPLPTNIVYSIKIYAHVQHLQVPDHDWQKKMVKDPNAKEGEGTDADGGKDVKGGKDGNGGNGGNGEKGGKGKDGKGGKDGNGEADDQWDSNPNCQYCKHNGNLPSDDTDEKKS